MLRMAGTPLSAALCMVLLLSSCSSGNGNNNRAPQAADDHFEIKDGEVHDFLPADLLANDSDPDGDPLALISTTAPAHGSLTPLPGGGYRYRNDGSSNSDSFGYRIEDSHGNQASATVIIEVTAAPAASPVAANDSASTSINTPVDIDILANDSDPDGNIDPATINITTAPTNGTVQINAGKVNYTPETNYSGNDTFSYTVQDESGLVSNSATVTIEVTRTNTPPVATGSCSTTKQEETLNGMLGADDPDAGETLVFALGADGSGGNGPVTTANGGTVVITDNTTGAYTYTPKPDKGGRGRDSFVYQVTDSAGATTTATETVIVDLKIMPLGDSITSGTTDLGGGNGIPAVPQRKGYRQPLQEKLASYGYSFDFVGALDHGCEAGYDFDANGWPGYTAQHILDGNGSDRKYCNGDTAPAYTGIRDALDENPADIILLHIGTNDVSGTSGDDIAAILDDIDAWENSPGGNPVTVILARIIDSWKISGGGNDPAVTALNNEIDAMVQNRSNDDVILIDMHSALNYPDDMGDLNQTTGYRLHPNSSGYEKMADVWLYPLIHQGTNKVTKGAKGTLMDKCE